MPGRLAGLLTDESGSASVYVLGCLAVIGLLAGVLVAVGVAVATRHQAEAAADLAALAAADAQQRGADPCAEADRLARANGAALAQCTVDGSGAVTVSVTVAIRGSLGGHGLRPAAATARAGVGGE